MKRVPLLSPLLAGIRCSCSPRELQHHPVPATSYPWLLALNGGWSVVLALVGNSCTVWREHRGAQFGSRLKMRLVLMFALMGVVQG